MPNHDNDFTRLELSLPNCLDNFRYFRSRIEPSTKLLVLVKANAYGHGAVEMSAMLQQAGADYLAVALPVEGIELRREGITAPILVLTSGTDFFDEMIAKRLEPGIPNLYTLQALCDKLREKGIRDFPIHIKLDTGMHRLGFVPGETGALIERLKDCPEVCVRSVYSHLAAADEPSEDAYTMQQIRLFTEGAKSLDDALGYHPMWHILNSAGIERFPQYQFDMVRLGIGIYGVDPVEYPEGKVVRRGLKPVASLKVKILQIKTLQNDGSTIGYGRHGIIAPEGTVIATIPAGYADGLDRHLGQGRASFLLNGHRVPTIGNICMDMCMLDITGVDAKVGDTVTIFGEDPTVTEMASILDTIPYEIMTSVPRRIKRVIIRK